MSDDPKTIVKHAYDHIADWYLQWVQTQPSPRERYTQKVIEAAPEASPNLLELGCGPGLPVTRMLLDSGCRVIANDISTRQLNIAQAQCPAANFVLGDMATLFFEPESFDGITCFYTILHLPRHEHRAMFEKIYSWLKPGGLFVFNLATFDEDEIHGEMMGHGIFWSSFDIERSKKIIIETGFAIVETEILQTEVTETEETKMGEDIADYGVEFLWIVAKKAVS